VPVLHGISETKRNAKPEQKEQKRAVFAKHAAGKTTLVSAAHMRAWQTSGPKTLNIDE